MKSLKTFLMFLLLVLPLATFGCADDDDGLEEMGDEVEEATE